MIALYWTYFLPRRPFGALPGYKHIMVSIYGCKIYLPPKEALFIYIFMYICIYIYMHI